MTGRPPRSLHDRFWSHVRPEVDGCWEWVGSVCDHGYGSIRKGPKTGDGMGLAHRVSWELHYGPIPDGLYICHRCDNPRCVRPDHLFTGTSRQNQADMTAKGRGRVGERNGRSKLTADQVLEIRASVRAGRETRADVAKRLSLCWASVDRMVSGRTWAHIGQEPRNAGTSQQPQEPQAAL